MNLNERVARINRVKDKEDLNDMIEEYFPFILKTISSMTGRYVEVENSDELSIGLMAFHEAIESFKEEKGNFISYAKLVITSRIKNHFRKESKHRNNSSIDEINSEGEKKIEGLFYTFEKNELSYEIELFEGEIVKFGFDLEKLADHSPKHQKTRESNIELGEKVGKDDEITTPLYAKFRLPITKISNKYGATLRVLKRHKIFITASVIIFFKEFKLLQSWVKDGGENNA